MTDDRPVRRLLFLLPFAPRLDAVHGGSRTTAQLLVPLAQRHRVALLYLRGPGEPPVDDGLRSQCEFVEEVARDAGSALTQRLLHRLRVVGSMMRGKPEWVSEWTVPSYEIRLRALARAWQPDIVQVEYHVMGQYLPALRDCAAPRVLIQHDPGAAAARQRHQLSHGIRRLRSYLGARAWQHYEQDIMRQVQAIIVFTERDRKALAPVVGRVPIIRIPIGTILPARPLDPVGQLPPSICFVGSFIHPPNADAAVRLITSIFPRVQAQVPAACLHVVGDDPPPWVRALAGENVLVTGRVPDVSPYLDRAALVVVPIRLGGGMRVKVLEALAAGKAIVASALALEGLDVNDGEQVLQAETDQQFCDAIVSLLQDTERRVSLARRARVWACANLSWDRSIEAYERLYTSLITR